MKVFNLVDKKSGGGAEKICCLLKNNIELEIENIYLFDDGQPLFPDEWVVKPKAMIFKLAYLVFFFMKSESGVIHSHLGKSLYICAVVRLLFPKKFVHIHTEHNTTNRRRRPALRYFEQFAYSNVDVLVAISRGVQDAIVKFLPFLESKSEVIYNGTETPDQVCNFSASRQEIKLLHVGSHSEQKNVELLIKVLARLPDKFVLTLVGQGERTQGLINLAESLGVSSRVSFEGWQNDVAPYYRKSELLVVPSKWEGFGLIAVEAASYSLPVIGSKVEGLDEVLGALSFCHLVDSLDNYDLWVDAIIGAAKKSNLSAKDRERLHHEAKEFDVSVMAARYKILYEKSFNLLRQR